MKTVASLKTSLMHLGCMIEMLSKNENSQNPSVLFNIIFFISCDTIQWFGLFV